VGDGLKIFKVTFVTAPRLVLRLVNDGVELSWAAGLTGFRLQSAESLAPGSQWLDVQTTPVEANGEAHVLLEAGSPERYFRLLNP